MSEEQVKSFLEKMKSDVAFRERILAIEKVEGAVGGHQQGRV